MIWWILGSCYVAVGFVTTGVMFAQCEPDTDAYIPLTILFTLIWPAIVCVGIGHWLGSKLK